MSATRPIGRDEAVAILALIALMTGCAAPHAAPDLGTSVAVKGLSPQSSTRYQCGPSTLASVLGFHGDHVPEDEIAGAIYSPSARGTLLADMAWFARQRGFEASIAPATVEDLRRAVESRCPPIVLLDVGIAGVKQPHFTAVTGFEDDGVLVLGKTRPDEYARLSAFLKQWNRAGNMALKISPRAAPSP